MSNEGISAFGVVFKLATVAVGNVRDISGPGISREAIDITPHNPTNRWAVHIKNGIIRQEPITFTINYVPTNDTHKYAPGGLLDQLVNEENPIAFEMVFPDDAETTWSGNCHVIGFNPDMPADGSELTAEITVQPTGEVTLA